MISESALLTCKTLTPIHVFWELSKNCNLKCIHCYVNHRRRSELMLDKIQVALEALKQSNSLVITFSGGEPLLRKDFFDIAYEAKRLGFAIKLFTNATTVDSAAAKKIARLNFIGVEVSLYSHNSGIHDRITGVKGSWERTSSGIMRLMDNGVKVKLKCSILKYNYNTLAGTIDLFKSLGLPFQFNPLLMPSRNGSSNVSKYSLRPNEFNSALELIYAKTDEAISRREKDPAKNMCSAGINSVMIDASGDVFPCVAIPDVCGNITKTKFSHIWRHSEPMQHIRSIRSNDIKKCSDCSVAAYCSRCPGMAFLKRGSLTKPYKEACRGAQIRSVIA